MTDYTKAQIEWLAAREPTDGARAKLARQLLAALSRVEESYWRGLLGAAKTVRSMRVDDGGYDQRTLDMVADTLEGMVRIVNPALCVALGGSHE